MFPCALLGVAWEQQAKVTTSRTKNRLVLLTARSRTDAATEGATSLEGVCLDSTLRPDGYDLALTLPLARLGRIPTPGDKLGFDLIVNDNDGTFRRAQQLIWTGAGASRIWLRGDYHPPQRFGILVF